VFMVKTEGVCVVVGCSEEQSSATSPTCRLLCGQDEGCAHSPSLIPRIERDDFALIPGDVVGQQSDRFRIDESGKTR
jgi:hypothetical protein